jgi:hypothetical protein
MAFWDVEDRFDSSGIHSAAFAHPLRGHRQPKSAISSLLREFFSRGIFDFFNTIGQKGKRCLLPNIRGVTKR